MPHRCFLHHNRGGAHTHMARDLISCTVARSITWMVGWSIFSARHIFSASFNALWPPYVIRSENEWKMPPCHCYKAVTCGSLAFMWHVRDVYVSEGSVWLLPEKCSYIFLNKWDGSDRGWRQAPDMQMVHGQHAINVTKLLVNTHPVDLLQ